MRTRLKMRTPRTVVCHHPVSVACKKIETTCWHSGVHWQHLRRSIRAHTGPSTRCMVVASWFSFYVFNECDGAGARRVVSRFTRSYLPARCVFVPPGSLCVCVFAPHSLTWGWGLQSAHCTLKFEHVCFMARCCNLQVLPAMRGPRCEARGMCLSVSLSVCVSVMLENAHDVGKLVATMPVHRLIRIRSPPTIDPTHSILLHGCCNLAFTMAHLARSLITSIRDEQHEH